MNIVERNEFRGPDGAHGSILAELFPVGEMIADELEARGWSQGEFAEIIGRPEQFVSEILSGKRQLTRDSARQVGAAFGTSADMWLRMQDDYLLWVDSQKPWVKKQNEAIKQRAALNELVPLGTLRKQGFVSDSPVEQQLADVLALFDARNLDECESQLFAARRSDAVKEVSRVQRAWVACVRSSAAEIDVAAYDKKGLEALVRSLGSSLRTEGTMAKFQAYFAQVGVKLVYLEAFRDAKIDGCSFIVDGKPAIGLSGRGKRLDKVFFTLLHEVAHVLLGHLNAETAVIDDLSSGNGVSGAGSAAEDEADSLAGSFLFPAGVQNVPSRVTKAWIAEEAERLQVPEIVLIGNLQNRKLIPWKTSLVRNAPSAIPGLEEWEAPRPFKSS